MRYSGGVRGSPGAASRRSARAIAGLGAGGFVLPWTLLVLLIVALLAAGGFLVTWLEGQSARAFTRATEAFFVAEGGLATALALAEGPNPSVPPVSLGGGTATVTFEPLLDLRPGERLFRAESRGAVVTGGATFERSVGQILWIAGPPRLPGALVLVGGVGGPPPDGSISGLDPLGSACPEQPSPVAGVAYWGGPPPAADSTLAIAGAPPDRSIPGGVSVAAETGIRWTELLADWGPQPHATVPPDPWPGPGIGGGWPAIRIPGSVALGAGRSGRGALVVEGDLTLDAGFSWRGIILVGGALFVNGNISVRGALASGLAGGLGVAADFGGHVVDLRYDACALAEAGRWLTAPPAGVPGTWYEVW